MIDIVSSLKQPLGRISTQLEKKCSLTCDDYFLPEAKSITSSAMSFDSNKALCSRSSRDQRTLALE